MEPKPSPATSSQPDHAVQTTAASRSCTYDDPTPPFRFLALARAFGPSRAFQVAVKIGLFEAVKVHQAQSGSSGVTAQQLAMALGLKADPGFRGVRDILDLLVAEDCLRRQGDGEDAQYSNTPEGGRFLCPSSPDYMGGLVVVNCERTYPQFVFLEDSLRTGVQPPAVNALVPDILATFGGRDNPEATQRFALGMTGANAATFKSLAAKFDFGRYTTLVDIGGSAGTLCCTITAAHPHMRCRTLDLPPVLAAAQSEIKRRGLEGRVEAGSIDFFEEAFPAADVITMSMILHDWGLEKKLLLMRKAFDAIPPGGAFISLDLIIDDERRSNRWGLYMSLGMLTEFGAENAFDYSHHDFRGWAAQVGFERTEVMHLGGPASAVVAYKGG